MLPQLHFHRSPKTITTICNFIHAITHPRRPLPVHTQAMISTSTIAKKIPHLTALANDDSQHPRTNSAILLLRFSILTIAVLATVRTPQGKILSPSSPIYEAQTPNHASSTMGLLSPAMISPPPTTQAKISPSPSLIYNTQAAQSPDLLAIAKIAHLCNCK